jgi:uncharacterized protein involved in type VI secretion and phage assembly
MNTGFFGKYRGTVTDNKDTLLVGRVKVKVPYAMGDVEDWALPCFPYAAIQAGVVVIPPVGANVWVEFEGGDIDHPIWVGGFYPLPAMTPALALAAPPGTEEVVIQVGTNNTVSIKDLAGPLGGILLKSGTATLMVNDQGIFLSDGSGGILTMTKGIISLNPPNLVVLK